MLFHIAMASSIQPPKVDIIANNEKKFKNLATAVNSESYLRNIFQWAKKSTIQPLNSIDEKYAIRKIYLITETGNFLWVEMIVK